LPLDTPWDISLTELNSYLRAANVATLNQDDALSARELDAPTRSALVMALREAVRRARDDAPPVAQWLAASESLVMSDDGSEAAREKADTFWSRLTQIAYGSFALAMLGDPSEFSFFIELLRYQPAGHLAEMAADVLRYYVDPSHELDTLRLLQRAEEWWSANQTSQVSRT
jgi:hypothetical protein